MKTARVMTEAEAPEESPCQRCGAIPAEVRYGWVFLCIKCAEDDE